MNSIFLYIIADLRRFVKEMGVLFTIRLLIVITKVFWQQQKREHLFAGGRGSNSQAAIRKDVLEKNIAYFWANVKWENKNNSTQEAQMPSAIRLALEKAGYIDQNGRIKDMQETDGSSTRKNSLSEKTSDEAYLSAVERGDMETAIRETSPLRNEGEHGVGTGVLDRPNTKRGKEHKKRTPRNRGVFTVLIFNTLSCSEVLCFHRKL